MADKEFIRKKFEVEDGDKRTVYGSGAPEKDTNAAGDNVLLVGLPFSGRAAVGRLAAELLGRPFVDAREEGEDLEQALRASGLVIVVPPEALADEGMRARLPLAGKVFYFMADVPLIMSRMVEREGIPAVVRAELANELTVFEPQAMAVAHFVLQAAKPPEALAADIQEKLSLFA